MPIVAENRKVIFENLGRIRYKAAWDYQETLFEEVKNTKLQGVKERNQYLLFCEHEPVYTLGKSGNMQNLLITEQLCLMRGIDFHPINRGGDITYHGPGQLVAYPIIDMESFRIGVKAYINLLEEVVIETLAAFGITGEKDSGSMGVWIDLDKPGKARKICAIGVRTAQFVTMHGLALNVNTDLNYFRDINPCGITDKPTTSMQQELGAEVDYREVEAKMEAAFEHVFGMELLQKRSGILV